MDKQKIINIVTINKDNKKGLEKTIESVISQTFFSHIHYIIIDGGSTDGSKELIESVSDKLYYWVSEPDTGIYNAMNKGLEHCDGDYVLFLNSADILSSDDVIEKVLPELDCDIVYGNEIKRGYIKRNNNFKWCDELHRKFYKAEEPKLVEYLQKYPDILSESFFKIQALPHQSTFISVPLHKKHPYSEKYRIIGDWKFLRERIIDDGVTYRHLHTTISVFDLNGLSSHGGFLQEKQDYYKNKRTGI